MAILKYCAILWTSYFVLRNTSWVAVSIKPLDGVKMEKEENNQYHGLIGDSNQIVSIKSYLDEIKSSKLPVLIEGETGVGKSLIASIIHKISTRAALPFIILRCGAMPKDLLENELFGHEVGAFTGATREKRGLFEVADKGTLFLDEVGEIDLANQAKILDVIETGKFRRLGGNEEIKTDVRIITATNRNLKEEVDKGRFRQDLFFRLNVLYLYIPPLRERKGDIPSLIEHFITAKTEDPEKFKNYFSIEEMETITGGQWLGNSRELLNFIEKTLVFNSNKIKRREFIKEVEDGNETQAEGRNEESFKTFDEFIENAEKTFLEKMLKKYKYNKTKIINELKISRAKFYRMLNKYDLN
jgi:DNA-binding NtrC family response regulator